MKVTSTATIPFLVLSIATSLGCAAMINGSSQDVAFRSRPSGASVMIDGVPAGHTPTTVKLKRRKDHIVLFERDGHREEEVRVESHWSGAAIAWSFVGAVVWWGPFEWLLDLPLGSLKELNTTSVRVELAELEGYQRFEQYGDIPPRQQRRPASGRYCVVDAFGRCMQQPQYPANTVR